MTKPFALTVPDYYFNAHIGTCTHNDPNDSLYDFISTKPLDLHFNYGLSYEVLTTKEIIHRYGVVWINTPVSLLFSLKAMSILNAICPDQFQTFNTVIRCKDGDVTEYKAINILSEVDVSDPHYSKFSYLTDEKTIVGYRAKGFVIKDQALEPIHIGREKYSSAIIISATLKEAFEKAKIRGCRYWSGDEPKD